MAERTEERPISAESVNAIIYSCQIHHSVIALFAKYTLDMIFSKLNNRNIATNPANLPLYKSSSAYTPRADARHRYITDGHKRKQRFIALRSTVKHSAGKKSVDIPT